MIQLEYTRQRRCFILKAIIACFLLMSSCHAMNSSADSDSKKEKYDSISWLKKIADKGQEATLRAKTEKYDFKKVFSDDIFDIEKLRKSSFEIMDTGIPSKVGYGFLMGYTSGFCLKKVIYCIQSLILYTEYSKRIYSHDEHYILRCIL
jgi:hypothetical protein